MADAPVDRSAASVPAAKPPAHGPSWKAEAIRRGHLRFNGPSPLDDDFDLDDQICDEGPPHKKRLTDPNTFLKDSAAPARRLLHKGPQASIASTLRPSSRHDMRSSTDVREPSIMQSSDWSSKLTPDRSASFLASSFSAHHSASHSATYSASAGTVTKRNTKRGSISTALKKIFGGGRKRQNEKTDSPSPSAGAHFHHHSELVGRKISPPRPLVQHRAGSQDSRRSQSFSARNSSRATPVSHLPFPMNVNAPPQEDGSQPSYMEHGRPPPQGPRRRATLPSVVRNSADPTTLSAIWSESQSRTGHDDQSVREDIGVAYSGSPRSSKRTSRRRSRSVSAIDDLKLLPDVSSNRQSGQSFQSSNWHKHLSSSPDPSTKFQQARDFRFPPRVDSRYPSNETPRQNAAHVQSLNGEEIRAFDFGPIHPSDPATPRTGPQTPSARAEFGLGFEPPPTSIEDRLERLETNMRYFDQSLRHLRGRNNRQTIILENSPTRHPSSSSRAEQLSDSSARRPSGPFSENHNNSPVTPATSYPSHSQNPSASVHEFPVLATYPSMGTMSNAPTMVATAHGLPQISYSYNDEGLASLYSLLYQERTARQDLEVQVEQLRREIEELKLRADRRYPRVYQAPLCLQTHGVTKQAHVTYTTTSAHTTANIYNYASYPGAQNAYATSSPNILMTSAPASNVTSLNGSNVPSTHVSVHFDPESEAEVKHLRYSAISLDDPNRAARKSHFSFDSEQESISCGNGSSISPARGGPVGGEELTILSDIPITSWEPEDRSPVDGYTTPYETPYESPVLEKQPDESRLSNVGVKMF
ncbi:uncharacterized protein IWZ02DRAFT_68765 [Phyllosticta citriasiana]|uniref:Uncharacterized protein n=1 Tax=Phyllosticta citriasiana TaxID=595635 RepID=A0ABR1KDU8_9PEZI